MLKGRLPFFTQAASYYGNYRCFDCPGITELYTPSIPTPASGYAVEGVEGPVGLAAFDAIGDGRTDAAQALTFRSSDDRWTFTGQRVAVDCSLPLTSDCPNDTTSVHDDVLTTSLDYTNNRDINAYFTYGDDSGSSVTLGNQAQRYDGAVYYYTSTFAALLAVRKVGYYYDPADGLVAHPDIAGYAPYVAKIWPFSSQSVLSSLGIGASLDRYHNDAGDLDQTDNLLVLDALTRNRIDAQVSFGSSYLLSNNCATAPGDLIVVTPSNYSRYRYCQIFSPISQNGISLTWHSGTINTPGDFGLHGPSSTPVTVTYDTGRFGPGRVDSWSRTATMRTGIRGTFSVEADDTRQYLDSGATEVQWLERAGYTHAFDSGTSISFGVRREIGVAPYVVSNDPSSCVTYLAIPFRTAPCTGAWNLAFAFHKRTPRDELYFGYGDAAQLSTLPRWVVKWIHYAGAEKGT